MMVSPVLLNRPFYQSESEAVNRENPLSRSRYLRFALNGFRDRFIVQHNDAYLNSQSLGFTEKINWYRLRAIENS